MAITVKHKFVSAIPDSTDATIVRPSNWNDDHDLTGTIPVANGGTGASTLTGYVYGNGTSAMTASTTVPSTAITGLGTMSTQNANAVAITGGTAIFSYASTNSSTSTTPALSYNASNSSFVNGATVSGSYLQNIMQNKSGTAGASTNFAVSNDLGTDSTYYGEFGMNSSVYSSGTPADFFSLNNGVYYSGHDGDISYGSGNGYKTYLAWGTTGDKAHVINASGAIGLNTNITGTTNFGTSGQPLLSGGSSATPTWGTLGISGGGTNATATPTAGTVAYGTGTAYAFTAAGTSGQVLQSNGASAPTWVTSPTAGAGGSTTQVQYNSSGVLAGSANMTFSGTALTLANDATINGIKVGKGGGSVTANTAVGLGAMAATATGSDNSAFGYGALGAVTSGAQNTAVGLNALNTNQTGSANTATGRSALFNNTASNNTANGQQALFTNSSGSANTAVGHSALFYNTTASNSTASGYYALQNNVTGGNNSAYGYQALLNNTSSSNLVAVGYQAALSNTTNLALAAIASGQITAGTGGTSNTYTAVPLTYVSGSTAFSYGQATIVVSGGGVTSVTITSSGNGYRDATTVLSASSANIGSTTGFSFTLIAGNLQSGTSNTAVGYTALYTNSTASGSTAVGYQSLYTNSTGIENTAVGNQTLYFNTTGIYNNCFSGFAGYNITTGSRNNIFGYRATQFLTTGSRNTSLGDGAGGNTLTTGSNNTYIGASASASGAAVTNEMVLGYNQTGLGSNTTVIGNSSTTGNYLYGMRYQAQPAITALTATATLTIAQMLTDIITVTSATAVTLTLPTGTLTDAGIIGGTLPVRGSFDWSIINLGSAVGAVSIANGTDHTFVGGTVAIGTSSMFRTVKTATNTYITYLIS